MAEKKGMPGWLKGCLTGCAVLILVAVLAMTYMCVKFKGYVGEVKHAEDSFQELVEELGDFKDYIPAGDVSLQADRVELFLKIREEMSADREALSGKFREFPMQKLKEMDGKKNVGFKDVFGVMKEFADLLNPVGEYLSKRNENLLREKMPIGEYAWIYSLAYYSWLGHPMDTAPDLGGAGVQKWGDDESPISPKTQRERYHRVMLRLLENRLDSLENGPAELREQVKQELDRVTGAPDGTVIWESGLPAGEAAVLEPYRDRLEATWNSDTNVLELPYQETRQGKGFRFEVN